MNEKWLYKDLTKEIISASMEVHRELGSGFLEYVYEEALCYESGGKKKNLVKICVILWL
jgi:GxxExxY protein